MKHDGKHGGGAVATCRLCKRLSADYVRRLLAAKNAADALPKAA